MTGIADEIHLEVEGIDENGLFIRITRERFANLWYVCGYIHRSEDNNGAISNNLFYYDDIDSQTFFRAYHNLIESMSRDSKWIKERYNVRPEDGIPTKLHIQSLRDGSLPSLFYSRYSDGTATLNTKPSIDVERNEVSNSRKSNRNNGGNAG